MMSSVASCSSCSARTKRAWTAILDFADRDLGFANAFRHPLDRRRGGDMSAIAQWANPPSPVREYQIIHERNCGRLHEIVVETGWPRRSHVGEDAADAAWLLQHFGNVQFQRHCLDLLLPLPLPLPPAERVPSRSTPCARSKAGFPASVPGVCRSKTPLAWTSCGQRSTYDAGKPGAQPESGTGRAASRQRRAHGRF